MLPAVATAAELAASSALPRGFHLGGQVLPLVDLLWDARSPQETQETVENGQRMRGADARLMAGCGNPVAPPVSM